jgi:iron-sulfur cluster assembly accessory protein
MTVTLTASAAERIRAIVAADPGKTALRVSVNGGGCSGFQYGFELAAAREPEDIAVERDGATVLIDAVSLEYLGGAEIDFVDDLIGQSFKVRNPNAKSSCGCGVSFTV